MEGRQQSNPTSSTASAVMTTSDSIPRVRRKLDQRDSASGADTQLTAETKTANSRKPPMGWQVYVPKGRRELENHSDDLVRAKNGQTKSRSRLNMDEAVQRPPTCCIEPELPPHDSASELSGGFCANYREMEDGIIGKEPYSEVEIKQSVRGFDTNVVATDSLASAGSMPEEVTSRVTSSKNEHTAGPPDSSVPAATQDRGLLYVPRGRRELNEKKLAEEKAKPKMEPLDISDDVIATAAAGGSKRAAQTAGAGGSRNSGIGSDNSRSESWGVNPFDASLLDTMIKSCAVVTVIRDDLSEIARQGIMRPFVGNGAATFWVGSRECIAAFKSETIAQTVLASIPMAGIAHNVSHLADLEKTRPDLVEGKLCFVVIGG